MPNALRALVCAVISTLALSSPALADDHPYSEGQVVNIAQIRTEVGHFEEYMKWLDTTWKASQEAGKKAGWVVSYEVLQVEPRGPNEPDLLLVTRYKNWAALDGAIAKGDAVSKQVEGSIAAADESAQRRVSIRRVLGSTTMQVLNLK